MADPETCVCPCGCGSHVPVENAARSVIVAVLRTWRDGFRTTPEDETELAFTADLAGAVVSGLIARGWKIAAPPEGVHAGSPPAGSA